MFTIFVFFISVPMKVLTVLTQRTLSFVIMEVACMCLRESSKVPAKLTSLGFHSMTRNAKWNSEVGHTMAFRWVAKIINSRNLKSPFFFNFKFKSIMIALTRSYVVGCFKFITNSMVWIRSKLFTSSSFANFKCLRCITHREISEN